MGLRRWISSMKSTSPGLRFVSRPARSPGLSRTGPEVTLSWECISLAMMFASVVLPSPGGPCSNTWSSESPRMRAAWMKMRRFSTIFSCPAKFCNSCGRILFSNSRSLSMFRIVDMVTKGNRMFRYAGSSGTVFHFPVAGIRSGGCIYGSVFSRLRLDCNRLRLPVPETCNRVTNILIFRKISAFAASKNAVIVLRRCGGLFPQRKKACPPQRTDLPVGSFIN